MTFDDRLLRAYAGVPGTRTIVRCADGLRWQQATDEPTDAFVERAKREARYGLRRASPDAAIRIVALRPRLTVEQWQARHNLGTNGKPDRRSTT